MSRIHRLPLCVVIQRRSISNVRRRSTKIAIQIIHHLTQRADLVKELRALAEQNAAEQTVAQRRTLSPRTLKIGGVERSGVGHSSVMLGMLAERPEQRHERMCEAVAKIGSNADGQAGFLQASPLPQRKGLIQRNTEHVVRDFQLADMRSKRQV